ncbi:CarD family transcriptional regulator [Oscillibacter hominis]|uniref:CarD family transcriptional regulator n=1 Tax=Oscillibacter hominis TaxID=2763056 RepID=A0A7G9B2Z7_9FIRM|nr:CarD family transcriptional regulator [Oscillibacter hominis]QNL43928.1 CarD family transcriptional regulator [Oscillibacter hominis]
MYETGQLVVYGTTGVCRVEGTGTPDLKGVTKLYYFLRPLYQDGVIYAPVDSEKVPIRPVISREEAERLVALIPSLHVQACHGRTLQQLAQHYQSIVQTSDCRELMELTMSIYAKRQEAEQQKHRLGIVDEKYMRQAERLLHGELSAALGIPYDQVPDFIASHVGRSAQRPAQ